MGLMSRGRLVDVSLRALKSVTLLEGFDELRPIFRFSVRQVSFLFVLLNEEILVFF